MIVIRNFTIYKEEKQQLFTTRMFLLYSFAVLWQNAQSDDGCHKQKQTNCDEWQKVTAQLIQKTSNHRSDDQTKAEKCFE